ncbi:hypothetical protein K7B10_23435 [Streptomyces flavotricini]|uniref:Uncharacterized protein n=1 Tax=Streptomyces flavotricini TaxID=66888 RepID=A0ABS8E9U1_9ACTN|nr:hypothetical protein [Streptomyces flavotricini]MCC0097678.1 hypothetical protein [Streptomyces flavotricini]
MDETLDLLDALLDGVSEPRLNLISEDEAPGVDGALGLLEDANQSEDIRRAAGEMRFRMAHASPNPRHQAV